MVQDPPKSRKLRSTLITLILATLPCYLLGFVVLGVGNSIKQRQSLTATVTVTTTASWWGGTATNTLPPIPTYPPTETLTPTLTNTVEPSATFFIPSDTPTPTETSTSTPTITVATTDTPTVEITTEIVETTAAP